MPKQIESARMESGRMESVEMRDAFGETLVALGHEFPNILVLDADLHTSSKTQYFKEAFPTRFIQVGIAEQNMFGIAAGLAMQGFIPFPSTFAVFASKRALDQISTSVAYPNLNVKIPGSYVGIPTSRAGASHNAIEDMANMRVIPNMRVADPGDNRDLAAIMRAAVLTPGPIYFRITRYTLDEIFAEGHTFAWGKGNLIQEGGDVTLVGTGMMTGFCFRAADILRQDGIAAEVLHCGSIKPIDGDLLATSAGKTGAVVTAENASVIGGLGSAVAEVLSERAPAILRRVGVHDRFVESGGIGELLAHHRMRPEDIAAAAHEAIAAREGRR
jgi:transketolase